MASFSGLAPAPSQIDRYLTRQLGWALLAVTGGLVALVWLTQSLRFVELVVNRGLSFGVFFQLTSLLIPNLVAIVLPVTTYAVVQFVYQRLASDRELTVMRAAGLSPLALARPALTVAAASAAVMLLLNLYIVPHSFFAFREFQFEIRNRIAAFLLQEGVFTPVSEDLTVYVRTRDRDGTLRGVLVEDARDRDNRATILAQRGRLLDSGGIPRVVLSDGSRQTIDKRTGRLDVLQFGEDTVDLGQAGRAAVERLHDPIEMSMDELLDPRPGVFNARDLAKMRVEANRRLATPLTCIGFTMVALVAVLMGAFRRYGGVLRPLASAAAVVVLMALQLAAANLATRVPALVPLIWLQAVLPVLAAAWLLFGPQFGLVPRRLLRSIGAV